jgi:ribosomal protein L37AE/L43A
MSRPLYDEEVERAAESTLCPDCDHTEAQHERAESNKWQCMWCGCTSYRSSITSGEQWAWSFRERYERGLNG